ncbi:MAG: hypothetical protein IPM16_00290 [Chloroflexi bacterium]|nr:hypothetical protein [Chloroflexota bacterium]
MPDKATFYIDKSSGTFADTLAAFGWMRVLAELHEKQETSHDIHLRDDGAYFTITCAPIQPETLDSLRHNPLWPGSMPMIETIKNRDSIPAGVLNKVDYELEKERVSAYFSAKAKAQAADASVSEPHRHWDIFRAINPASLPGYNGILNDWWVARDAQPDILNLLFQLFSTSPNDLDGAVDGWKALDKANGWGIKPHSTGQQLYNPDQGKGQNKAKSNGLSVGNLDNFWLLEWLKIVGFYEAAQTRLVQGVKDRKTYVIAPRELTYTEHREIFSNFANSMRVSLTSIKGDTLAALRYTEALLTYFDEPVRRFTLGERGRLKKRLVAGLYAAFYKDLGNAVATMNLAFIGLPGWIEIGEPSDIALYTAMVQELVMLVNQFDETHSDAIAMLQALRDFVSADTLDALFRFTRAFPAYYIGMRERNKYVYAIQEDILERIITMTEPRYAEILEDEGFRNIAYAIRASTVTAQFQKSQGNRKYDVRYGLGQDLARKSRYKDDFIAALSEFMFKFNAENAQVMEVTKMQRPPYRRSIQTSDIESVVALIDRFGSETVANLLIAYGYARTPRKDAGEADDSE